MPSRAAPVPAPSGPRDNPLRLRAVRNATVVGMLPFFGVIFLFSSQFSQTDGSSAIKYWSWLDWLWWLLAITLPLSPYLLTLRRLGRNALKNGLALGIATGCIVAGAGAISLAVAAVEAGPARDWKAIAAFGLVVLCQAPLLVTSIRAYYDLQREAGDRRTLAWGFVTAAGLLGLSISCCWPHSFRAISGPEACP
ncbi:MAG: hypothetical protein LAN62_15790 [Acidobacteriia bacterium]|nr:hypothetical protein [Terriglobia bacterium]